MQREEVARPAQTEEAGRTVPAPLWKPIWLVGNLNYSVRKVQLSADGQLLLAIMNEMNRLRVLDISHRAQSSTSEISDSMTYVSSDRRGSRFATASKGPHSSLQSRDGRWLPDLHQSMGQYQITAVTLANGLCLMAFGYSDSSIRLYNSFDIDARVERWISGHGEAITDVRFFLGDKKLAMVSYDDIVKIWDVNTKGLLLNIRHSIVDAWNLKAAIAISPDGRAIAVTKRMTLVRVYHTLTGKLLYDVTKNHKWDDQIPGIAFTANGRLLLAEGTENGFNIYEYGTR
ncbi:WD40-repeat-containing domain protein [Lophiotrema nucula]|uniref:WD40-repeat-containing domain protein n=1 Tax=Lophiotrema nucula TaxID=690887 RepID=A0A6A5ZK94_9PLEO|nr:WD40-repeat-containing domain protein [Lophiotrema nucula]